MRYKAYLAGKRMPKQYAQPFETLQWFPERLEEPLRMWKPQVWAVGFQADIALGEADWLRRTLLAFRDLDRHTALLLTKRPDILRQKLERARSITSYCWPLENVWLGLTVCTQAEADSKIPLLLQTPAARRWVSLEPLLEAVDLSRYLYCPACNREGATAGFDIYGEHSSSCGKTTLDWVVLGGESGPKARPMDVAWARSVKDQCVAAGVPFYYKQGPGPDGKLSLIPVLDCMTWRELPWAPGPGRM